MNIAVNRQLVDHENVGKLDRSPSKCTEDSGICTEEEDASSLSEISSDDCEENYHFVEALKVLGVHKQEVPKVHYLFVIIVRWNDKSQVTVYRKWREIKEFQHAVLKASKSKREESDAYHYIKKTANRVKKAARFHHGTIKKLDMIDSLNNFFEAVVHYGDTVHSASTRRFFKPTETDLDSLSWSGNGRTYFYVTRDILGEKNHDFDVEENCHQLNDVFDDGIDPSKHINEHGTAIQQTQEEFNDALEKYNEADPNITWPIKSSLYVAVCDFDASAEDPKDNIIGLTKGEEVDVLEKNETGWWLVTRTQEKPKTKNGLNECGYVPASHLEIQSKAIVTETEYGSFDSSPTGSLDDVSSFSFHTTEERVHKDNVSVGEEHSEALKEIEMAVLLKRGLLQKLGKVQSFGSMSSINESDWSGSPFTSTESLTSSIGTPTPTPRKKALAFIERSNQRPLSPLVQTRKAFTPLLGRQRLQSDILSSTNLHGSMTPPIVKRSQTLDSRMSESIPDLFSAPFGSPTISPATSTSSLTNRGTDYVSIKPYHAINDDELSFEQGSVIKVISKTRNGWWFARYKGKSGLVPSVNLKRYRDPIRVMSMHMMESFS